MGATCCKEDPIDLSSEVELFHFTLLRSVGRGSFGKVRVVEHKGTKRLYALKYINKDKCIKMKAAENILSERRLLERIDHSLVVNLRYAFQDDENIFMVIDLMLGGDLRFHLERSGFLPENHVQFYAAQVACTLHYLHGKNIIHRDIKPDNILLDEKGHAHLTDFNVAVQIQPGKSFMTVAGSMAYIAPEMLKKQGYSYSVDWWSLGISIYELLYGKRPFAGKSNEDLQQCILHDPIIFPKDPKVSQNAIDFIKQLLERDIHKRIGVGEAGFERLKSHAWLKTICWDILASKTVGTPFIPDGKKSNFDPTHEIEEALLEENPLKVKRRVGNFPPKKSMSNDELAMMAVEDSDKMMLEERFLVYDYTKPQILEPTAIKAEINQVKVYSMSENHQLLKKSTSTLISDLNHVLDQPKTAHVV